MIPIFDTHFHYDGEVSPEEFCAILPPRYSYTLLAQSSNLEDAKRVRVFAQKISNAYFACGVHPHDAAEFDLNLAPFAPFRADPKLAAIGEIGMDFFYDFAPEARQIEVFELFLNLALEWNLPAVVHLRDRDDRCRCYELAYDILRNFSSGGGRFVVHCFSSTPEWAEKFLGLGGMLGVTGMVTFKKSHNIRRTLAAIPLDRLLIETDSPYLAPVPHRGKPNHPAYLPIIAQFIADEKGVSGEELCRLTDANGKRFFKLP